jgi:hypothetical protein
MNNGIEMALSMENNYPWRMDSDPLCHLHTGERTFWFLAENL